MCTVVIIPNGNFLQDLSFFIFIIIINVANHETEISVEIWQMMKFRYLMRCACRSFTFAVLLLPIRLPCM